MKRGYLIYHPEEAQKNSGFIQLFQQYGKKRGIDFFSVSSEEYTKSDLWDTPDIVLNRTRDTRVSLFYEKQGINVFHESSFVALANDKFAMIEYFKNNLPSHVRCQHWCPESIFLRAGKPIPQNARTEKLLETGVVKSLSGHGGSEVFLAKDRSAWEKSLAGSDIVLQEKIESEARDVRVYILGGEIYQAVLRQGTKDFRSNFSLGGNVTPYALSAEQRTWVGYFLEALSPRWKGMFGIDFLLDVSGQLIFNEVEEMVGCRMLYQCTDRDIVRDYVNWMVTVHSQA
jgi:glutathione synthase/RimK-type ligase-like ATP-grasp enzyme